MHPSVDAWEGIFTARLTARATVSGKPIYSFEEGVPDPVSPGDWMTLTGGRTGTQNAYALNDEVVPVPSIVWLRFHAMTEGELTYEFGSYSSDVAIVRCTGGIGTTPTYCLVWWNGLTWMSGDAVAVVWANDRGPENTATHYKAIRQGSAFAVVEKLADADDSGLVSISAQTFSGHKTMPDGTSAGHLYVYDTDTPGSNSLYMTSQQIGLHQSFSVIGNRNNSPLSGTYPYCDERIEFATAEAAEGSVHGDLDAGGNIRLVANAIILESEGLYVFRSDGSSARAKNGSYLVGSGDTLMFSNGLLVGYTPADVSGYFNGTVP